MPFLLRKFEEILATLDCHELKPYARAILTSFKNISPTMTTSDLRQLALVEFEEVSTLLEHAGESKTVEILTLGDPILVQRSLTLLYGVSIRLDQTFEEDAIYAEAYLKMDRRVPCCESEQYYWNAVEVYSRAHLIPRVSASTIH